MTPEQHAAVEAVYRDLSEQLAWPRDSGIKRDPWTWHQMMLAAYARYKGWHILLLPSLDGSGMEPVYRQKQSRLTVRQGAELKHFARAWAIDQGVVLREPDPVEEPPLEAAP